MADEEPEVQENCRVFSNVELTPEFYLIAFGFSALRLGLLQSSVIAILLPVPKLFGAAPELFHY